MTTTAPNRGLRHLDATQALVRRHANEVHRAWRGLDPGALRASFVARVSAVLVRAIQAGQVEAAALAEPYVSTELADAAPDAAVPVVNPAAFAGITSAGLPLSELADLVSLRLLTEIGAGRSTTDAMLAGLRRALTYTATEITDAGRIATQVQLVVHRRVAGYERVVKLPACDRCIILTGRLYRCSQAFDRHPRCDCTMRPVTYDQWANGDVDNSPDALFRAMSTAEQNARFGVANAAALRAGADVARVVNARRGALRAAGRWRTATGGPAGRRRSRLDRPTAGQVITDHAGSSREELISALRRYGYVL